MKWIRARSEEQKEVRMAEIVSAAARLYERHDYDDINMVSIAREARFTRSNLYKYFSTKEEIFIELIKNDINLWTDDLTAAFHGKKNPPVGEFAALWVAVFMKRKRLAGLISILFTTLEKNATVENLIDFKLTSKDNLAVLIGLLCGLYPVLTADKAMRFVFFQMAAAIGLYPMANTTDKQMAAMKATGLEHTRVDFAVDYTTAVRFFIDGLIKPDV